MKSLAFVLLAAILIVVGGVGGPIACTRAFGVLSLLIAVAFAFAKEVPFSFGDVEVVRLRGWTKAFLIVPALAIGLLLTLYAPEITCLSYKHRHLCTGTAKP